jgi:hypothetical protein
MAQLVVFVSAKPARGVSAKLDLEKSSLLASVFFGSHFASHKRTKVKLTLSLTPPPPTFQTLTRFI